MLAHSAVGSRTEMPVVSRRYHHVAVSVAKVSICIKSKGEVPVFFAKDEKKHPGPATRRLGGNSLSKDPFESKIHQQANEARILLPRRA